MARARAPPGRSGVRGRGFAAGTGVHPLETGYDPASGEEVADFEEYTRPYWESWGDPVIRWLFSTVSIAMVFDDRRHARRLEHLALVAGGDEPAALVGGAGDIRADVVLDLSVHRQPVAAGASRRTRSTGRCASRRTPVRRSASTPRKRTKSGRGNAGATTATSARVADRGGFTGRAGVGGRSSVDLRRGGMGLDPGQGAGRLRPLADRYRIHTCWRSACTTWRPGTRRSAMAPGAGWRQASESG